MAPALTEAIKVAGLVLVADTSTCSSTIHDGPVIGGPSHDSIEGVNGVLNDKGVLKFYDTIDM